jgi:hypothetical protein
MARLTWVLGAVLAAAIAGPAQAAVTTCGPESYDFGGLPRYSSQTFGGIDDSARNNLDLRLGNFTQQTVIASNACNGTLSSSGASMTFEARSENRGFARAGTSVSASITNSVGGHYYYSTANWGSRERVLFTSATAPGRIDFVFNVSGTTGGTYALDGDDYRNGRLDFLVKQAVTAGSLLDVFTDPAAQRWFGPGTYTYSYFGPISSALDVWFYTGSGFEVNSPTSGKSGTISANFFNTFELVDIALFDSVVGGNEIMGWSLTNETSGQLLFTADGRVEVAEPGALTVLGFGLLGLAAARRRQFSR